MSYLPYTNFLANLNSLSPESSPAITEQDLEAELGLWRNVQFTFDVPPGMAIYDEDSSSFDVSKLSQQAPSEDGHDSTNEEASPVSFETLSQYLDYGRCPDF